MHMRELGPERFGSDRRGTVAVTVGLACSVLLGMAALGIDLGTIVHAKRKAQGAADVAAMLAATDPTQADALARRSLADNGYADGVATVSTGRYAGEGRVAPAQRFTAGGGPINAVRVNLKSSVRASFTQFIGLPARYDIAATGTAASVQLAAFTIGSGAAALDGGIANAVLGAMLRTNLSLSAMDYNVLLSARVDSYRVLEALGAGSNALSFNDILSTKVRFDQVLIAMKAAGGAEFGAGAIDRMLAPGPSGDRFRLGDLLDLGDAGALSPGSGTRGPSIGAMDTISAAASLANGDRQVQVDLGARIPGLLSTKLTLGIGERRQSSGWVQPGTPGATVRTAQTRLLIEARLAAPLGLGTSLTLPLYAEAAYAQASLRSTTCPWSQPSRRQVRLDVQPGLLDLAIANVSPSAIVRDAGQPDLSRDANLLTTPLPLLTITGRAHATLASPAPQTLTFSDDDITNHRTKRISSNNLNEALTKSLIDTMSLNVVGLGVGPLLRPALKATLSAAAPALDLVLDNTLRTLGIHLGYADVTVDGTRCDHAVLVQ